MTDDVLHIKAVPEDAENMLLCIIQSRHRNQSADVDVSVIKRICIVGGLTK